MKEGERKFDDVLYELGEFGRYQIVIFNLLCLLIFIAPWQTLGAVFISGDTDHWCKIPEWDSVDCDAHGFNTTWECSLAKRDVGIPWNYSAKNEKVYDRCHRYNVTGIEFSPDLNPKGLPTIGCNGGWMYYNEDPLTTTMNQDFDLVCGGEHFITLQQSLFFAGNAIGAIVGGTLSDKVGRHRVVFTALSIVSLAGIVVALAPNVWVLLGGRFIAGAASNAMVAATFVLANEFVGPSKRSISGNAIWVYCSLGYMLLALIAFFIRNWRHFYLIISAVPAILLPLSVVVPESPRWLLSRDRETEARKIVRKLAKVNKVTITETFTLTDVTEKDVKKEDEKKFMDLLRKPRLRMYTLNIMFNLIVNTLVYFGVSLSTGSLGVNVYIAFAIAGAVEIPACFGVIHPIDYFGRRPSYMACMFIAGIALLATIFIPLGVGRACVAMVGKFAITSSFSIVYLHAVEIVPTPVRNEALGACTLFSNMANILGPQIIALRSVWDPLPLVIFGSLSIIAGIVSVFLPETRGKKIPETIEEGENIGWRAGPRQRKGIQAVQGSEYANIKYQEANGMANGDPV
ncbi:organic cation transporter protein-like [Diadema antillarum]|uniref:organic cation transporter protein-like n=1 Tax=Diadema antillarum TaxID=105358 RepID=UPI003A8860BD